MSVHEFAASKAPVLDLPAQTGADLASPPGYIELLPLAIYACDAQGRVLWYNRRAAALWGREPAIADHNEKYCGSYKVYVDGQHIMRSETPMARVLRTGEPIHGVEAQVERPDGSTIWAMVHIDPVRDAAGNLVGAINCFHETTAFHHATDEVEDFFDNSAVAMHLVSRNGVILRANKAELAILGYSAAEYVGRSITEIHADKPVIDDILRRLLRGDPIDRYRARLRAKDGSIRNVEITSNARLKDGKFVNTRCVTVDVTDRVNVEQALARRIGEQAALFELTEKLHRATDLDEVYEAALDAMTTALCCARASILIFDDTGVMRFVA